MLLKRCLVIISLITLPIGYLEASCPEIERMECSDDFVARWDASSTKTLELVVQMTKPLNQTQNPQLNTLNCLRKARMIIANMCPEIAQLKIKALSHDNRTYFATVHQMRPEDKLTNKQRTGWKQQLDIETINNELISGNAKAEQDNQENSSRWQMLASTGVANVITRNPNAPVLTVFYSPFCVPCAVSMRQYFWLIEKVEEGKLTVVTVDAHMQKGDLPISQFFQCVASEKGNKDYLSLLKSYGVTIVNRGKVNVGGVLPSTLPTDVYEYALSTLNKGYFNVSEECMAQSSTKQKEANQQFIRKHNIKSIPLYLFNGKAYGPNDIRGAVNRLIR